MSNKKRQSRRRVLRGGDDAKPAEPVAATTEPAAVAESGSFMGNLFSTESNPEAAPAEAAPTAAAEAAPAAEEEASPAAEEEMKPVAAAATAAVMASTYKTKKSKKSKAKKGKKCKTAKGNCKKWFKLNKNRLCASASPPM